VGGRARGKEVSAICNCWNTLVRRGWNAGQWEENAEGKRSTVVTDYKDKQTIDIDNGIIPEITIQIQRRGEV